VVAVPVHAQSILIDVRDASTSRPIQSVRMVLEDEPEYGVVLTNVEGRAQFADVSSGTYLVEASSVGYETASVEVVVPDQGVASIEIDLVPRAIALDSIRVDVDAVDPLLVTSGFYERSRSNRGFYYDPERLDRIAGGVRVSSKLRYLRRVRVDSFRNIEVGSCRNVMLYLDGVAVRGFDIDDAISPREIVGIEVYDQSQLIPIRYREGTACAAILFWTRR